eukprot:1900294-Pyramimonas_sp.AAC.1
MARDLVPPRRSGSAWMILHGPTLGGASTEQARLADLITLLRSDGGETTASKYQEKLDKLNQQQAIENISVGQAKQKVEQAEAAL